MRVVVSGIGCISSIGLNANTFWNNLLNKVSGIVDLSVSYPPYAQNKKEWAKVPVVLGAPVPSTQFSSLVEKEINPSFKGLHSAAIDPLINIQRMSPFISYALACSWEALQDARWFPFQTCKHGSYSKETLETGVVFGTGFGDVAGITQAHDNLLAGKYSRISPYLIPNILVNMASGYISQKFHLQGPNHSVATACATGGNCIGDAYKMIKDGKAKVMVCGSSESAMNPVVYAGFARAKALATKFDSKIGPRNGSRPFSPNRDGFVIGEGGAVLVLEELEHAIARNAKIYCEITGYTSRGSAFHETLPEPNGEIPSLLMKEAMLEAKLQPDQIQHINAHATSTPDGDKTEMRSIERTFKKQRKTPLKVTSVKGSIGHLMGASGSIEALTTVLSVKKQKVPPTLNYFSHSKEVFSEKDSPKSIQIVGENDKQDCKIENAISNSFGFGGTNSVLLFSKFE